MFIGHYAVALAAKKAAPKVSLGTLFFSVQLVDMLWPLFLLVGLEHVRIDPGNTVVTPLDFYDYPITHSLVGALAWSLLFGLVYFGARRYTKGALILAAGVFSHWVLDLIVHSPDLPLMPGGVKVGLGLWNSRPGTLVVELGLYAIGIALYLSATTAQDRTGRYALWALLALFLVLYLGNIFNPTPPPSATAVAWLGLGTWLFVPWAYWIDRHRRSRA